MEEESLKVLQKNDKDNYISISKEEYSEYVNIDSVVKCYLVLERYVQKHC